MITAYELTHVKNDSTDNIGVLDVHNKEGEIALPPSQFTLDFWIKCKFNLLGTEKKEIFGMYLYDDENASTSIYDSSLIDGEEIKLDNVNGITSYINIYVDPNRNNNYIFNINNYEREIEKYKMDNEWNHIALVYDKLNNTSCIWYLNGNPILGLNISNEIMQQIINKKFCRFLWTMYKDEDYLYLYKVNIIESDKAGLSDGIKYNGPFYIFDRRKYVDKNDNIDIVLEEYNSMEIKPTPGHYNYSNLIYLPMQTYITEDLGEGEFEWSNKSQYSPKVEGDIADILTNDAYNRISDIVSLKNFKCDDRDPISLYYYDDDYRIDLGNAAALHAYSNLRSLNTVDWTKFTDGFTIDWFAPYFNSYINAIYNTTYYGDMNINNIYTYGWPNNTDYNSYLIYTELYYPQSHLLNSANDWETKDIFKKNSFFNYQFTDHENVKKDFTTNSNKITMTNLFNMEINDITDLIYKQYLIDRQGLYNFLTSYDYNSKRYDMNSAHNFMMHYALVFKPGGKFLYFVNGNKIDRDIHDIIISEDSKNYHFQFNSGKDAVYYPQLGVKDNPFQYFDKYLDHNYFNTVKDNRYLALNMYENLDQLPVQDSAKKYGEWIRESNKKLYVDYKWPDHKGYYYTHFNLKAPIIFNHFRVIPNCLWYDNSFDPLTDTRIFDQDWDTKYNTQEQIISDIEEDNIALLYPVNNPATIYDRRYSKNVNARKDSTIQKSNFQVEPISPDTDKLKYNTEITQKGEHKPVKYTSYPAITTNTYKDNNNVIVFRNHHIEDKPWTVDLWVYPKLQTESYSKNIRMNLIFLNGFGLNGNIQSSKYKYVNGSIGLRLFSYGNLYIVRSNHNNQISLMHNVKNQKNSYLMYDLLDESYSSSMEIKMEIESVPDNVKFNFDDWNHIAIVSDIENYLVYIYINGIKVYTESERYFSHLHRLFLYTGFIDNWIKLYYTGLKVTVGEAKYTEDNISGWENC